MSMRVDAVGAYGVTVLRVLVGVVFLAHGYRKLFEWGLDSVSGSFAQMGIPLPYLSAVLASGAEFVGGLALVVGLGTRLAGPVLAFTMLVAIVTASGGKWFAPGGMEYPLTLLAASVALTLLGSGAMALDNVVARAWTAPRPHPQPATA